MAADTELAWAAGFFDGEGSSIAGRPWTDGVRASKGYARISVSQASAEPLERFQAAVGGNLTGPDSAGVWRVQAAGQHAVRVMRRLWPYLGCTKRKQFIVALRTTHERNNG